MEIHLVDGTYELFRAYFGAPSARAPDGREVGATRGLIRSLLALVRKEGATHVGIAFDTVVESFRNELFDGYKTGEGIDPDLFGQFELAERAARAAGFVVWSMIEFEADDAIASAALRFEKDERVERVLICSPDKDLMQCVRGHRIVCVDRRRKKTFDEDAVIEKLGVAPDSIPDYLALVGDTADGIPGIRGWGARTASTALRTYRHLDAIPDDFEQWTFAARGAATLAATLRDQRDALQLYRTLATLRDDVPIEEDLEDLEWRGAHRAEIDALAAELGDEKLHERIFRWR